MNNQATTVLMCGIGGQGTITAASLLASTVTEYGLQVKMSEIHGMSQRGGAVTTIVRFGEEVHSMVCDEGQADCILSFETTEALRNVSFLKKGGALLVNQESIKPQIVLTARKAGTTKCANVVLLGALASTLPFEVEVWERVIASKVPPKTVDINLQALHLGMEAARS